MGKFFHFFVEVKTELQKVVWPTRRQTLEYTAVVILFSVCMSVVLGAADFGLLKLFEKIVTK